uniref:Carboxypeptidase n=1 Tax=Biston betularia TaxID=82595 RepID=A0A173FDK2_BISBE|nr:vitellogenic carboxypeptidase-like protein [Biston betularia]
MKLFLVTLFLYTLVKCFPDRGPENTVKNDDDPGSPLMLTPYIESGKIQEAKDLSRVAFPDFPEVESYAGFFTVDKTYNSNQFFWYFPAQNNRIETAVMVWLQGGPGASSLFGLFAENGPFEIKNDAFQRRDVHWAEDNHLIYIDNPVGTGFSFTNDSRGYCTNQTQIGEHLYSTITQFFQLFPELQQLPFFVSGESYAGKYVPALGYTIHKNNPTARTKINLKGLIIGNGWSDPINQLNYSDYLYQIGLIDWIAKRELEKLQNNLTELVKAEAWHETVDARYRLYDYIQGSMGNISLYNYLPSKSVIDNPYPNFIDTVSIRKAIHVGDLTYDSLNETAYEYLKLDIMKSVAPWISELIEHYHILFYNGQTDIIVAYPLTINFLRKLKFSASEKYLNALRMIALLDHNNNTEKIAFVKRADKLTEMLIRDASHMVPADQPEWIYSLILWWRLSATGMEGDIMIDGNKIVLQPNHE